MPAVIVLYIRITLEDAHACMLQKLVPTGTEMTDYSTFIATANQLTEGQHSGMVVIGDQHNDVLP